jgi:hypothetical protein
VEGYYIRSISKKRTEIGIFPKSQKFSEIWKLLESPEIFREVVKEIIGDRKCD